MTSATRRMLRDTVHLVGVGIGVTIIGLIVGAMVVSPTVSPQQRALGVAALCAIGAGLVAVREAMRAWRGRPTKATRQARQATPPAAALRGTKRSRTPRAVAALAAAGANPTEIAWKTGLPVDAVSMLLEITGTRTPTLAG